MYKQSVQSSRAVTVTSHYYRVINMASAASTPEHCAQSHFHYSHSLLAPLHLPYPFLPKYHLGSDAIGFLSRPWCPQGHLVHGLEIHFAEGQTPKDTALSSNINTMSFDYTLYAPFTKGHSPIARNNNFFARCNSCAWISNSM